MSEFTHEIPDEISRSDERWLKVFTKKSLIASLIAGALGYFLGRMLSFGNNLISIGITIFFILITFGLTTIKIPEGYYLRGQGLTLDVILLRIFLRRRQKIIYVKNYNEGGGL